MIVLRGEDDGRRRCTTTCGSSGSGGCGVGICDRRLVRVVLSRGCRRRGARLLLLLLLTSRR